MIGLDIIEIGSGYVFFRLAGADGEAKVVNGKVVSAELLECGIRLESERDVREEIQRALDTERPTNT